MEISGMNQSLANSQKAQIPAMVNVSAMFPILAYFAACLDHTKENADVRKIDV